jgi:predicted permease
MIESLFGTAGLPLGMLIDQLGSYLALSTVGIAFASAYAGQAHQPAKVVIARVLFFPPFVALLLALLLIPVHFPAALERVLGRLGDTVAPLALVSVGLQLRLGGLREHARALCLGLGYKLLICPGIAIAFLWLLHARPGMASHVTVIESAMPPMIGAGIVASQAKLDPGLVCLMIGIGIPVAFSTVPAWTWVYGSLVA